MIHFLYEGGNRDLKDRRWVIPDGVRAHLESVMSNNKKETLTSNHTTKEAYNHLEFILGLDNGISYNEMKRIKNWFYRNTNATKTKQYELYGGDVMKNWVNNALDTAVKVVKANKESDQRAGLKTREKDERDRQTKVSKVDDKTPTYNPATLNKLNRLKELTNINERVIVLTEQQSRELVEKLFIINNK